MPKVHGLIGYRKGNAEDVRITLNIILEFISAIDSDKIHEVWRNANFGHKVASEFDDHFYSPLNATAIVRNANVNDRLGLVSGDDHCITRDSTEYSFIYYWIEWTSQEWWPYVVTDDPDPDKNPHRESIVYP